MVHGGTNHGMESWGMVRDGTNHGMQVALSGQAGLQAGRLGHCRLK